MGPTAVDTTHAFDEAVRADREPFKVADLSLAGFGRARQLAEVLASDPALARARSAGGHTPLHAVREGPACAQMLDLLLDRGADLDAAAGDGATPLSAALERGDEELAALLRARSARE